MSETRVRQKRRQRLIADNPICCFCGGGERSTSEDHVPPRACFPSGFHPEGLEFPACNACNQDTRRWDDIFGFYAMAADFNDSHRVNGLLLKKGQGLANNYPTALPSLDLTANQKRARLKSMGIKRSEGIALSDILMFRASPDFRQSATIAIRKMTAAFYYKETGKILSKVHRVTGTWHQMQDSKRAPITKYFNDLLPEYRQPARRTIRNYGKRLCYKFGYMDESDFFAFVCQIGEGLILTGMTISPGQALPDNWLLPVWQVGSPWSPVTPPETQS
ncbi:hypothetical protein [Methylobacterium sp. P1-11]|uniref:hypothetical protein n=1 Tax=Methylobacterium sp. P1-11 TaxID=2024616 RepID=UPI0011F02962|nr:hypothetical protein [Methylobacterium sp. P1-11]